MEALTHSTSECDNTRDAAFKEGFQLEEISKLGANTEERPGEEDTGERSHLQAKERVPVDVI